VHDLNVPRPLKWYLLGLASSAPPCFLLALGLHALGLSSLRLCIGLVFSLASFLSLFLALAISFRKVSLPRQEALKEAPEEVAHYYSELKERLSAATWAMLSLAITLMAIMMIGLMVL